MISKNRREGRVDVVIPTYNAAAFIEDALDSVVAQGDCVARIIVIDDGSIDDTEFIVKNFQARHAAAVDISYLKQTNAGPSAARNFGLARINADFVALLDADDVWTKDKLRKQLAVFDAPEFENLGVVYCNYGLMDQNGLPIENFGFRLDHTIRGDVSERLLEANLIAGSASAVLVRKECLQKVGWFDDSLVCAEDWDLWLRLAEHYDFDFVDEELVWLRQHANNAQSNEVRMLGGELLFLNKLYLRNKLHLYHVVKFWKRLVKGHYDGAMLNGFELCDAKIQRLVSGHHVTLPIRMHGYYMRVKSSTRNIFDYAYERVTRCFNHKNH